MNYLLICLVFINLAGILCLNEPCTKNTDCSTENAVCLSDKCVCDDLSKYNNTVCLPYAIEYNDYCYETSQCEWLGDNADCKHNRCVCKDNFRWFRGKCQAYVDKGEACQSAEECYNGYDLQSLSCSTGTCTCSNNYYDRGHDCRKSSSLSNGCALDIDCGSWFGVKLICSLGKCELNTTDQSVTFPRDLLEQKTEVTTMVFTDVNETISCRNNDDCQEIAHSICDSTNETCGCNAEHFYYYNGNCVRGISQCSETSDCTTNNTMCFRNSCVCEHGFFLSDKQCIAELGMENPQVAYTDASDCPIKPGKLEGSACYCKDYWFNDDANRNCIKTMIQSIQSCLTNEWCDAMGPYSFCNSTTSTCQCNSFAKLDPAMYYCEKVGNATDVCLKDSDCEINERCLDEKCECEENFTRNDENICLPNIGASCEIAPCSHIGNASCAGAVCACHESYIGKVSRCLKIAEKLYDSCEEKEQCQNIEHSVCGEADDDDYGFYSNETQACVCEEGFTAINSTCHQNRKYGDPCMSESDCTVVLNRSYKCRNSICQCAVGLTLKNGYCTSSASASGMFGGFVVLVTVVMALIR